MSTYSLAQVIAEASEFYDPEAPAMGFMRLITRSGRTIYGYVASADDDLVSVTEVTKAYPWSPMNQELVEQEYLLHIRTDAIESFRYANLEEVRS